MCHFWLQRFAWSPGVLLTLPPLFSGVLAWSSWDFTGVPSIQPFHCLTLSAFFVQWILFFCLCFWGYFIFLGFIFFGISTYRLLTKISTVCYGGYEILLQKFNVWSGIVGMLVKFCGIIPPRLGGKTKTVS